MLKRRLSWLAVVACLQAAANVDAQDRTQFGPLPPAGDAAQRSPDERWDVSYWDTDFDGKPDLIGYHPDGRRHPTKVEKYRPKP